ncbi:hypothetical protein NL676_011514 [Syzygium grande]|nr:hypothetical protein NL676_011514 [Syzygium grande]
MEKWAESGQPVELMTEMNKVTYTVITNILFGMNVDYDIQTMERLFYDLAQGLISIPINLPGCTFHKALKARRKLVKILQANLEKRRRLKNKKEQATEEKDVLDLLMEVEDEDGERLDEEVIIDVSLMFLLAGHETSAHATMWAAIFLKDHPEILQKLKKEQEEIIRRRPPTQKGLTLKEIRQMDYLSKVVDETLRRGNISFAVFREATADVNINGYLVPKGWRIVVYLREIHADPENYAKPEEFDPSRWELSSPPRAAVPAAIAPTGSPPPSQLPPSRRRPCCSGDDASASPVLAEPPPSQLAGCALAQLAVAVAVGRSSQTGAVTVAPPLPFLPLFARPLVTPEPRPTRSAARRPASNRRPSAQLPARSPSLACRSRPHQAASLFPFLPGSAEIIRAPVLATDSSPP